MADIVKPITPLMPIEQYVPQQLIDQYGKAFYVRPIDTVYGLMLVDNNGGLHPHPQASAGTQFMANAVTSKAQRERYMNAPTVFGKKYTGSPDKYVPPPLMYHPFGD